MQNAVKQGLKKRSLTFFWGQNEVKLGSDDGGGHLTKYKTVDTRMMGAAARAWVKSGAGMVRYGRFCLLATAAVAIPSILVAVAIAAVKFAFSVTTAALGRLWAFLLAYDVPFYFGVLTLALLALFAIRSVWRWDRAKVPQYEYWKDEPRRKTTATGGVTIIHNYNINNENTNTHIQ